MNAVSQMANYCSNSNQKTFERFRNRSFSAFLSQCPYYCRAKHCKIGVYLECLVPGCVDCGKQMQIYALEIRDANLSVVSGSRLFSLSETNRIQSSTKPVRLFVENLCRISMLRDITTTFICRWRPCVHSRSRTSFN